MSDEFNLVTDLAESRAQVYGAYADFFSGNGSSGFAGNWSELVRYQAGVEALLGMTSGPAPEALPEPIVMDRLYARLFQGVGERTVPLCASAYTGEHRMMCGADCRRLLDAYRAFGFLPSEADAPFADSLGVELAFMSLLAQMKAPAGKQREFLTACLIPLASTVAHELQGLETGAVGDVLAMLLRTMKSDGMLLERTDAC